MSRMVLYSHTLTLKLETHYMTFTVVANFEKTWSSYKPTDFLMITMFFFNNCAWLGIRLHDLSNQLSPTECSSLLCLTYSFLKTVFNMSANLFQLGQCYYMFMLPDWSSKMYLHGWMTVGLGVYFTLIHFQIWIFNPHSLTEFIAAGIIGKIGWRNPESVPSFTHTYILYLLSRSFKCSF